TKHRDRLGELPRDPRAHLHADRGVAIGLIRGLKVMVIFRMGHKDRRSHRDVRLKLARRKLLTLQERPPEHRVEPNRPHGEIKIIEHASVAKAGTEGARLPADVRREVRDVQPRAEVEWAKLERKPVAAPEPSGERIVKANIQRCDLAAGGWETRVDI